jgi:hypothetical protein
MSNNNKLKILKHTGDFAENKDVAASLREEVIRPAVKGEGVLAIDFEGITLSTQSFIHALLSDVLRSEGPPVLDRIEFKNCVSVIRGLIETVVQYSLESAEPEPNPGLPKLGKKKIARSGAVG